MTQTLVQTPLGPSFPALGWVPAPRYWLRRQRVLSWVDDLRPGKLLEVGCGIGALLTEFQARGFQCTGVETSEAAVDRARQALAGSGIVVHSGTSEAWNAAFDLVCAFEVLEHIEDDAAALRQWGDYLRPGGKVLLSVPAHPLLWNASDEWAGHYRRYSRADLKAKLEQAGFVVERLEFYGFPIALASELARGVIYRRQRGRARGFDPADLAARTASSGVDRQIEMRLFERLTSPAALAALKAGDFLQRVTRSLPLGGGLLVLARTK